MKRKTRKKEISSLTFAFKSIAFVLNGLLFTKIGFALILIISATSWFFIFGIYDVVKNKVNSAIIKTSEFTNLVVENVYLEGQKNSDIDILLEIIDINIGQPILSLDIDKIKQNLENNTWIKSVTVERFFPSTISIHIKERNPVALWQNKGIIHLIDDDGKIIHQKDLSKYKDLVILVGDNIPLHSDSIFNIINSKETLTPLVSSAIRVGDRRWNVRLHSGIEIFLPEKNPKNAWQYLSEIQEQKFILDSNIKNIDLRVEGKMFIK